MLFHPLCLGHFLFEWLGVTRASDSPVPCGHNRLSLLSFVITVGLS